MNNNRPKARLGIHSRKTRELHDRIRQGPRKISSDPLIGPGNSPSKKIIENRGKETHYFVFDKLLNVPGVLAKGYVGTTTDATNYEGYLLENFNSWSPYQLDPNEKEFATYNYFREDLEKLTLAGFELDMKVTRLNSLNDFEKTLSEHYGIKLSEETKMQIRALRETL